MGLNRKEQKEKTRQSIIYAAFELLDSQKGLSSISLREVARTAGIAPTSFYRHFEDIDALGLTLVDEAGLALRQLMRHARSRMTTGTGVINVSVDTFFEFVVAQNNVFRLLLREHSGTSAAFRAAVHREIQHFTDELSHYIEDRSELDSSLARLQADAMVKLVFSTGAGVLDASESERRLLAQDLKQQLRFIAKGAKHYASLSK